MPIYRRCGVKNRHELKKIINIKLTGTHLELKNPNKNNLLQQHQFTVATTLNYINIK